MNCAQVKEQLIDFLYGELPPDARASFTEHLDGCHACKSEVASYQRTLGSARIALGGPLLEEPPARVHLAVLEAAKAAAKPKTATRAFAPRDELGNELGFLARLWRTPWFLPAFGTASVAAVIFLVRVLKNPEVLPGQRPHSIEERAVATPEPALPPEALLAPKPAAIPEAEAKAKAESDQGKAARLSRGAGKRATREVAAPTDVSMAHAKGKKAITDDPLSGLNLGGSPSSAGGLGRFAEPPPPRQVVSKSSMSVDDLLSEVRKKESPQRRAQPPAPAAIEKTSRRNADEDRFDGLSGTLGGPALHAPQPEPPTKATKPAARSVTQSAGAPTGAAAPAYAPEPAAAPAVQPMRDYPAEAAESATSAPGSSAPQPSLVHKKKMKRDEESAEKASALDSDEGADERSYAGAKDKKAGEKAGGKAGPSLDESVRKADRLFASQDWNAAATAYRDLLRRFPSHKDAPKWRDRMNESNVAYQRTLEAKRKKAVSDDPLSGSKL
jgi:anti-sigma factor RsiW